MLNVQKLTHEEAIRMALRDDPRCAGNILNASPGARLTVQYSVQIEVPVNLAKAVLSDYLKEQEPTHGN